MSETKCKNCGYDVMDALNDLDHNDEGLPICPNCNCAMWGNK